MSLYTILGLFFLGATAYPTPSGSGPGITVQQANGLYQDSVSSFTCTTSEGIPYKAGSTIINTNIHQMATCTGPNYWGRSVYPTDCDIRNQNFCWNNCAHNFSGECTYWCTCMNESARLGSGYTAAANDDQEDPVLGHSAAGGNCPWWLPQGVHQLAPEAVGYTCYYPGQFCQYPREGMNFYCQHGVWNLVGPAPAPSPSPAPSQCPSWGNIWDGDYCPTNGVLCEYPLHFENFMCADGQWQSQNLPAPPVPSPTPAPANPVNCPVASYPPSVNGFCSVPHLTCRYSTGTFRCHNGRWGMVQY